ncbi:MAG: helix-turn-helix domain-containing protein [Actinobacteria bacterium]|nr:helix-turn-helix domain-containing protein [Actinomycetota bacterium]
MNEATAVATDATSKDPAVGLKAVAALRQLAERLETLQVDRARRQGWTWQEIADVLGVSRQAVHKKHAVKALLRRGR